MNSWLASEKNSSSSSLIAKVRQRWTFFPSGGLQPDLGDAVRLPLPEDHRWHHPLRQGVRQGGLGSRQSGESDPALKANGKNDLFVPLGCRAFC